LTAVAHARKSSVPRQTTQHATPVRWWFPYLFALALAVATFAAYAPAWHGGLVWDDEMHVTRPALRSLAGLASIWTDVRATLQYYPVLHSAFWLEHRLWGDATLGYHLANIVEHTGVALLLALILRRIRIPGAFFAAFIFALHPVHTESVAWISEQKNTLSGLFYLGAAWLYLRFDETRSWRWYAASLGVFVLAVLSKTVTATLPGALLVVFWYLRGRLSWRHDVLPTLPLFIVGGSAATITAWFELAVNKSVGAEFQLGWVERILLAGRSLWFQLGKLIWPTGLSFMYPRWDIDAGVWWQYVFPFAAAALAVVLWAIRDRSRAPLAAFLLFVGTLFPVLGFFTLYTFRYALVANHYQYLASIGPITLAAAGLAVVARRVGTPVLRVVAAVVLVGVLGFVTRLDAAKFESSETLLQDTLQKDPRSWFACNNLGSLRLTQGRLAEARAAFEQAIVLKPDLAEAHNNLGNTWLRQGALDKATQSHGRAVALKPDFAEAHNNLGVDLSQAGRVSEAAEHYRRAITLDPQYAMSHFNLANALVRMRDASGAEEQYRQALAIDPRFALAHYSLGLELLSQGRTREADAELAEAFRLDPDFSRGYYELGNAQLQRGLIGNAIESYRHAIRILPDYAEAHGNLGAALLAKGRLAEAVSELEQAIRLKPGYAKARNNLGVALERQGRSGEAAVLYAEALRLDPGNVQAQANLARVRSARPAR
jgi:protein O-mannosyl-transferase